MGGKSNPVNAIGNVISDTGKSIGNVGSKPINKVGKIINKPGKIGKIIAPIVKPIKDIVENPGKIITAPITIPGKIGNDLLDQVGVGKDITGIIDNVNNTTDKFATDLLQNPLKTIGELPGNISDTLYKIPAGQINDAGKKAANDIIGNIDKGADFIGKRGDEIIGGVGSLLDGTFPGLGGGGGGGGAGAEPTPIDPGPLPYETPPNPSSLAEMNARRRLRNLRLGLLSTITTSPSGISAPANLLSPAAYATGQKTLLGT